MTTPYARAARLTGGAFAIVIWLVARGIYVSKGGDPLGSVDRIFGTGLHVIATIIALGVFFVSATTRVRNLILLADKSMSIERSLPGVGDRLLHETIQFRRRTAFLWFAAAFVLLALLIWLLAVAAYFGSEASTIVERGLSPLLVVLTIALAAMSIAAGFAILSENVWGFRISYLLGIAYSFAFPIGLAFAVYMWWRTRSLTEALRIDERRSSVVAAAI